MPRILASELEIGTSLLCAKVSFVAGVSAVVLAVTLPRHGNAAVVVAAELTRLTRYILATGLI